MARDRARRNPAHESARRELEVGLRSGGGEFKVGREGASALADQSLDQTGAAIFAQPLHFLDGDIDSAELTLQGEDHAVILIGPANVIGLRGLDQFAVLVALAGTDHDRLGKVGGRLGLSNDGVAVLVELLEGFCCGFGFFFRPPPPPFSLSEFDESISGSNIVVTGQSISMKHHWPAGHSSFIP